MTDLVVCCLKVEEKTETRLIHACDKISIKYAILKAARLFCRNSIVVSLNC